MANQPILHTHTKLHVYFFTEILTKDYFSGVREVVFILWVTIFK